MAYESAGYVLDSIWLPSVSHFRFDEESLIRIAEHIDPVQFQALTFFCAPSSPAFNQLLTEFCIRQDPELAVELLEEMAMRNTADIRISEYIDSCRKAIEERDKEHYRSSSYGFAPGRII